MVKIKGADAADKQNIALAKAANRADAKAAKTKVVQTEADTPEAKATPAAKSKAAAKLFKTADEAARAGLPADITVEQNEKRLTRAALGY
jgi:hypothetical protein